jgi:hypothetical protein
MKKCLRQYKLHPISSSNSGNVSGGGGGGSLTRKGS